MLDTEREDLHCCEFWSREHETAAFEQVSRVRRMGRGEGLPGRVWNSRQPEWITVRTGLFGTKESFVPIRDADLTDDGVRVPVSKERVKDAPKIDTDGHLSPQEEVAVGAQ